MRLRISLFIIAIIGAATLAFYPAPTRAQTAGIPDYKISWQTTYFLTATFDDLLWTRNILALGPSVWSVVLRERKPNCFNEIDSCYVRTRTENWTIPTQPNCFRSAADCNGSDSDHAKWLWATGGCSPAGVGTEGNSGICSQTGINTFSPIFENKPISDQSLYINNPNETRGDGPGMIWAPNPRHNGDQAIWTQGPYGYAWGALSATNLSRAGVYSIGTLIPLRWSVEGFNEQ